MSDKLNWLVCCRLDIPKAPLLLGNLLGQAVSEQVADGGALQKLCEPVEDTEARRELISNVLKFVQVSHAYSLMTIHARSVMHACTASSCMADCENCVALTFSG